ncbi:MAG: shikimate kinase AroK [Gammaproteobacteria bacterium]|nr:shikimate kinase AroK [Gammaproteobacteria bacterium]
MANHQNIFLIGLMGAGKTTIGRQLANELSLEFFDSDHEIEKRTGVTITHIFDIEGEAGFRKRETAMLDELTEKKGIVLATGGGAILKPENRQFLMSRGTTIYLYANIETLLNRTSKDRNRPLLQTENPQAKLEELLEIRDPLYRETADIIIDTGKDSVRLALKEILEKLQVS